MSTTRKSDVLGLFNHIILFAPDFPDEEQTNLEQEFHKLRTALMSQRAKVGTDSSKWLALSMSEVEVAFAAFVGGDRDTGTREIHSAEGHFKDFISDKAIRTRFTASADGINDDQLGS